MLQMDMEDNMNPITLYINCGGGSVLSGLALFDVMNHIKSPIQTLNIGMAASMASFILAGGESFSFFLSFFFLILNICNIF